ncbi:MAG: TrkH family potassium uptake protein, partial [Synergistaceae bacterium]|nr:TrkH family potassium uptake protein [Synergistaceae bacterium]
MKIKTVAAVLSVICLVVSAAMLPSMCIAMFDGTNDALSFGISMLAGIGVSVLLRVFSGKRTLEGLSMGIREGVGVTGFSWMIASAIGALPYWLNGAGYTDA